MRFDDRFLEELKARLRPSDVIGRTVKLKRQGREWVGLSPFTKEKSPSFFVNDDKGFFHDFSSGKHGDIISFLQETERLSFPEAVERLAAEAGMQMPAEDPQAAEREQKRQGLADWMDLAQKWFAANLRRSVGKAARDYLERRGLPPELMGQLLGPGRIAIADQQFSGIQRCEAAQGQPCHFAGADAEHGLVGEAFKNLFRIIDGHAGHGKIIGSLQL